MAQNRWQAPARILHRNKGTDHLRYPKKTTLINIDYQALAEDFVLKYNGTSPSGMLTVAIRPAGIHGERDTTLTKKLVEHGSKASPLVLSFQLGDNDNLFDFTYVGNIAYAHMLAAELLLATMKRIETKAVLPLDHERVDGEAFNITNDSPVYFWDMARSIWALMDRYVEPEQAWVLPEGALTVIGGILETVFGLFGKKPRLTRREVRYSCMTRYFSCDKAKRRLGYVPYVPLDEGVARSVGFMLEQNKNIEAKKQLQDVYIAKWSNTIGMAYNGSMDFLITINAFLYRTLFTRHD